MQDIAGLDCRRMQDKLTKFDLILEPHKLQDLIKMQENAG